SSRRRHTRFSRDWSSDVCSSDLFAAEMRVTASLGAGSGEANHTPPGVFSHNDERLTRRFGIARGHISPVTSARFLFHAVHVLIWNDTAVCSTPGRRLNPCGGSSIIRPGRPYNECHGGFPFAFPLNPQGDWGQVPFCLYKAVWLMRRPSPCWTGQPGFGQAASRKTACLLRT